MNGSPSESSTTSLCPDWHAAYAAYPVNSRFIWVNNCGTTPAGNPAVKAVSAFLESYSHSGILAEGVSYLDVQSDILRHLSEILAVETEELAVIHNTSEGMNLISHGLTFQSGDEILLLENEYPSNVYPWEHWRDKGVDLKFIPMAETPTDFLGNFMEALTARTRFVTLSAVHWCTGMPLPLRDIGALCRERDIRFAVDAAQGIGHVDLRPREWGIDYMAFSGWKWLLGPLGIGGLYAARERLAELRYPFKGTESVINDGKYLPYRQELKPHTGRYTYSTPNFNDWIYWRASLDFLAQLGFVAVRKRLHELASQLAAGLAHEGFRILSSGYSEPTAIVVVEKSGLDATRTVARLRERGIVAAERLGRLRFSPHVYNSPEQLQQVVIESARL